MVHKVKEMSLKELEDEIVNCQIALRIATDNMLKERKKIGELYKKWHKLKAPGKAPIK